MELSWCNFAETVGALWRAFTGLVDPASLRFWADENSRKHKAIGKAALNKVETWLAPGAPKREWFVIELGDAPEYNETPTARFSVYSAPESRRAHLVRISVPLGAALAQSDLVRSTFHGLAALPGVRSAQANPGLIFSRYDPWEVEDRVEELASQWHNLDIHESILETEAVGQDGVRSVGWLTSLDARFVAEIGHGKLLHAAASAAHESGDVTLALERIAHAARLGYDTDRIKHDPVFSKSRRTSAFRQALASR